MFERDPAARSKLEVLLCYPGVHARDRSIALGARAVAPRLAGRPRRFISQIGRWLTGIEIHPGAQ